MRGQHAQVTCTPNWGEVDPPAFAYDLFKAEMWKRARSTGLRRYGKATSGDDDTRPIGLAYVPTWNGGSWSPRNGAPPLKEINNSSYGENAAYEQRKVTPNEPTSYRSSFDVPRNTGHSIRAYLYEPPKTQLLKLWQIHWGQPGAGVVFQIRNGTPEIGLKSVEFDLNDLAQLNALWAEENPSLAQSQQIEDLLVKAFDSFESLSFEKSTSKTDWYNNLWAVTFIPEERGVVHVVLEGGDATSIEYKSILETGKPGTLWETSKIDLFCGGGAFYFQSGYPLFVAEGKLLFGPFREGNYYADSLGALSYRVNAYPGQYATFEKVAFDAGNGDGGASLIDFGFQAKLLAFAGRRRTPFYYGASARFANGARNGSAVKSWDSDELYEPANPETPRYTGQTVLDVVPSFDGGTGKRSVRVTLWNPRGALTVGQGVPVDQVATVTINGSPLVTKGIVVTADESDMMSMDAQPITRTNWASELALSIYDGWQILSEVDCDPSIIGDGLHLADAARLVLSLVGFTPAEMAGVVAGTGKKLPVAPLGEDFCYRPDKETTCADVLRALFDSFGLGWRFFQNRFGVWQMRRISTTRKGLFKSDGSGMSNLTPSGRLVVLRPIDISHDRSGFYNHFVAIGGKNGDIIREIHNWPSIRRADSPNYIGRKKTKRLRNTGLVTPNDVQYALRSMEFAYGRGGRRAQFTTFFHDQFDPGDYVSVDEETWAPWEIEALSGGSWAKDEAQFNILEVI